MGEKGLTKDTIQAVVNSLPSGYHVVKSNGSFLAQPDGIRPGQPLSFDEDHGVWMPPGFNQDPTDAARAFNSTSGQNAVWDATANQWIDTQTGKTLTYEQ